VPAHPGGRQRGAHRVRADTGQGWAQRRGGERRSGQDRGVGTATRVTGTATRGARTTAERFGTEARGPGTTAEARGPGTTAERFGGTAGRFGGAVGGLGYLAAGGRVLAGRRVLRGRTSIGLVVGVHVFEQRGQEGRGWVVVGVRRQFAAA
jgi:hypothetical protein